MKDAIDFHTINQAALTAFPAVLNRLLPGGKAIGCELVALNPCRADLVAYLADASQAEAARLLAQMLGLVNGGRCDG